MKKKKKPKYKELTEDEAKIIQTIYMMFKKFDGIIMDMPHKWEANMQLRFHLNTIGQWAFQSGLKAKACTLEYQKEARTQLKESILLAFTLSGIPLIKDQNSLNMLLDMIAFQIFPI